MSTFTFPHITKPKLYQTLALVQYTWLTCQRSHTHTHTHTHYSPPAQEAESHLYSVGAKQREREKDRIWTSSRHHRHPALSSVHFLSQGFMSCQVSPSSPTPTPLCNWNNRKLTGHLKGLLEKQGNWLRGCWLQIIMIRSTADRSWGPSTRRKYLAVDLSVKLEIALQSACSIINALQPPAEKQNNYL